MKLNNVSVLKQKLCLKKKNCFSSRRIMSNARKFTLYSWRRGKNFSLFHIIQSIYLTEQRLKKSRIHKIYMYAYLCNNCVLNNVHMPGITNKDI